MKSVIFRIPVLLLLVAATMAGFGFGQNKSDINVKSASKPNLASDDAVQGSVLTITAPTLTRAPGATFDATFRSTSVNGLGIASYQMDIHYDANVLQFNSCSSAGTISSGGGLVCNGTVDGLVELVWFTLSTPLVNDGDGPPNDLFKINFTVQGPNGTFSLLTFTDLEVQEGAVTGVGVLGTITINSSTAAEVGVSGRVVTQDGRPIAKALITLQNAAGESRFALSNPFGYFRFNDVRAGETYVVAPRSKKYTFQPRILSVGEEITGLDFVAEQ